MQPTIAVLNGVIFLIPGVLALWIGEWISGRKEESLFDRIAAALILSIPVYIAYRLSAAELGLGALGVIISDADPLSPGLSGLAPWAWAVLVGMSSIAGLAYGAYTWRRLTFDPWVRTFKRRGGACRQHGAAAMDLGEMPRRNTDNRLTRTVFCRARSAGIIHHRCRSL
jgi:hypothetical protein